MHSPAGNGSTASGYWGDYNCDLPLHTLVNLMQHLASVKDQVMRNKRLCVGDQSHVDFIEQQAHKNCDNSSACKCQWTCIVIVIGMGRGRGGQG